MHDRELNTVEEWKQRVQQDINDIKNKQSHQDKDISDHDKRLIDLEMNDKLQDREINTLHATLAQIQEDTQWIRRKITGAIITALVAAVIAGIVGIAISKIF